ncbi:MAG: nucleoid-associated protein [Thiolinea sp.]
MIDTSQARISKLIVHQIGNQNREEGYTLSQEEAKRSDTLDELLIKSYLLPSVRLGHSYDFYHESDLSLNTIHHFSSLIFDDPAQFNLHSQSIAKHLYSVSTHPNIGGGEFIIILFDGLSVEDQPTQALGFFRIEGKSDYLDVEDSNGSLSVIDRIGISMDRIQKGALTLSGSKQVYVIDSLGQKTKYWMNAFLKASLSETPKTTAKAAGDFLKAVSDKVESADQALEFNQKLEASLSGADELSLGQIRELSGNYLGEEQVSELLDEVREQVGLGMSDEASIDTKQLDRYTRNVRNKARLGDGISVIVARDKGHIAAVDVEKTENGLRAVVDIELTTRE